MVKAIPMVTLLQDSVIRWKSSWRLMGSAPVSSFKGSSEDAGRGKARLSPGWSVAARVGSSFALSDRHSGWSSVSGKTSKREQTPTAMRCRCWPWRGLECRNPRLECRLGRLQHAFDLFEEMLEKNVTPNEHVYAALMGDGDENAWLRAVCLLEDGQQRRVTVNQVMYGKAINCCTRQPGSQDKTIRAVPCRWEAALSLPLGLSCIIIVIIISSILIL